MTDDEVFDAMQKPLADVQMDRPVEAIERRGRSRRRNRTLLGTVAGGALAATAALAVAVPLLSDHATDAARPPVAAEAMEPAAFSVTRQADGTVELVLDYTKILNPAGLEKALAAAGIPAVVKADVLCTPQGKELPESMQVFAVKRVEDQDGSRYDLIIAPSRMPAGSVVYFSVFPIHQGAGYAKAAQYLVPKDAQMSCRTVA